MIFQNSVAFWVLIKDRIFDDRQRDRLAIQIKVQSSNAGMPVQRTQCADGQCHRLGRMGQTGGTAFDKLDRPGRHDFACRIQQIVPAGRPAQVGFSSGGFEPLPFFRVSKGASSGSNGGMGVVFLQGLSHGQIEKPPSGLGIGCTGFFVSY